MADIFLFAPADILKAPLTLRELRVLLALYSFRGKTTNTVWPSQEALGERSGVTDQPNLSRTLKSIESKGYITRKTTRARGKSRNQYTLTWPDESY